MIADPVREGLARGWRVTDAARLQEDAVWRADVVIAGSGAGGAIAAHVLSSAGLEVIVLEEGGLYSSSDFTLREAGVRDGLDWVEATPKTTDSGFEKLQLGFADKDLKSMELYDNFGQTTTLVFSAIERNPALPAAQFQFTPPAGVDVISE